MTRPLEFLGPAVELLRRNLNILPASGGAVEYLQHPDIEEIEDSLINREAGEITDFAETPQPSVNNLYRPTPPVSRGDKHLYRYFIDGSLRTYFLATGIEGQRSFPIQLAQVGAAVMHRNDEGALSVLDHRQCVLLLVPTGGRGVSDTIWQQLEALRTPDGSFEPVDVAVSDVLSGPTSETTDLRSKAGGKARHRMHLLEIDLIQSTEHERSEDRWLILDGAVKLDQFIKAPYLIGVAKSFRQDPQFYFGRQRRMRKDVTTILAGLPCAHRTVAFSAHNEQVAFWYVRLREQKQLDYPLMGVVKVELPRPDRTPVESELADLLSRALVAERNVTPYGRDRRWHCHLYPIYIAEQAIKNRFFSEPVLMGSIRWPPLP